jgi:hypothetical protein
MYSVHDLSPGERLYLLRRRVGKNIHQAAKAYNVTPWRYSEWEDDLVTGEPKVPQLTSDDFQKLGSAALYKGEACLIARRRMRSTITHLGTKVGMSHVTLIKWERPEETNGNPLYNWWESQGWPPLGGVRQDA